jgi:hypothetical protein
MIPQAHGWPCRTKLGEGFVLSDLRVRITSPIYVYCQAFDVGILSLGAPRVTKLRNRLEAALQRVTDLRKRALTKQDS